MIIVEGADLVGKTTFCELLLRDERLAERGYIYHHLTRPPLRGFDGCKAYIEMAWEKYVQDRYHLSAPVYTKMLSIRTDVTTVEKYRLIDAHMRLMGVFTVVIVADDDLIRERFESRKTIEMYTLSQILVANGIYRFVAENGYIEKDGEIYKPDIDTVITTTEESPFPTINTAKQIVDMYDTRQTQIERAMSE